MQLSSEAADVHEKVQVLPHHLFYMELIQVF